MLKSSEPDKLITMKFLDKIIQFSFYTLFILVPLILTPYNYELFEFNKMLTVYFFTITITSAWIIKSILTKKILLKRTPIDIPLILFLLSQIISTILSINTHTSLWGYYSRFHGGLISTISYIILYYAYLNNMTGKTKNVLKVILSTGLIVSIYGILEHFGIDKHLWVQDVQNRVFSTLGQPNWLAAYLICLIPISLHFSIKKPKYHLLTLTFFTTLLFTKSRSGLLGFSFAWSIYWLITLLKNKLKNFPIKPFIISNLLIFLTVIIIGTPWSNPWFRTSGFSQPNSQSGQFETSDISDLGPPAAQVGGSKSSDIRKVVWQGAINIWHHYPAFGSGVETFAYSYYNFRPVEHNLLSEWDFLYNKAHNEFLNFLATTGAFGLFSYCLIILWFTLYSLKHLKKSPLIPALLAGYLGLAVSNFFGFAVVPVALFFFLFPAFISSELMAIERTVLNRRPERISSRDSETGRTVLASITLSLTLYLLYSVINMWRADRIFNLGKNYLKANQIPTGYQYVQKATQLSPKEPLFTNQLAEASAQMALLYHQSKATGSAEIRDQLISDSIIQINQTFENNSVHLNFHKSKIKIYLMLATIDQKYYQQSLEAMLDAIDLAPTDAKLYYNLGLLYSKIGQHGLAEQVLLQTIDLKSNYEAARFALGSLYEQTDRPDLARQQYDYILKFLNPQNLTVKDKLEKI